jgi:hypothetical protein
MTSNSQNMRLSEMSILFVSRFIPCLHIFFIF